MPQSAVCAETNAATLCVDAAAGPQSWGEVVVIDDEVLLGDSWTNADAMYKVGGTTREVVGDTDDESWGSNDVDDVEAANDTAECASNASYDCNVSS